MILSLDQDIRDRDTESLFATGGNRRMGETVARRALQKISMLDAATRLGDLVSPPGNCLEALRGKRRGEHGMRINDQYRICFRWMDGDAYDVEVVDYH